MAKSSLSPDSVSQDQFERKEVLHKNHYFDNEIVERLMYRYVEGACTDVSLRDEIMIHASELIRQIIKAHNLGQICPGKDDTASGDLFQTAWIQIESALYKYEARPHCSRCYNALRPKESLLTDNFWFVDEVVKRIKRCPRCRVRLTVDAIYYKGVSKVFNLWCLSPKTKVISQDGIMSIGTVLDSGNLFYGINGFQEVCRSIEKPKTKTLKIRTMHNYEIEVTPEHHLFRLGDTGPAWAQAGELVIGDFLGIQCSQQTFVGDDDLSDIAVEGWLVPKKMNAELAYLLGLYIAEGSYGRNMISIYNTDPEVAEILQQNNLGLKFSYHADNTANYACSKGFTEFMSKIGFKESTSAELKHIPDRLLRMSKDNISALLSGIFDGDGHSSRFNGEVGLTSTSVELVQQVRMLLLNIGIISKLSVDKRPTREFVNRYGKSYSSKLKDAYLLRLATVDSLRFYDRIGFRIKRKQLKMSQLSFPKDVMLCLGDKFRSLYKAHGAAGHYEQIRRMIDGCDRITVQKAATMLSYWDRHNEDDNYVFIRDRLNEYYRFKNRVIWLPVKDISNSESEVCDVEISSDDHSYIANGFISHNSQIARTVALAYIKKENRDRKNSGVFQDHLEQRTTPKSDVLELFFHEAREICKYNEDHLQILSVIEDLYDEDEKPYDGLIGKLVERSSLPRATITGFLKVLRLRAKDFTNSPINEQNQPIRSKSTEPEDDEWPF